MDLTILMYLNAIIEALLILVILGLVKIYTESYKKIKVSYTVGLLLFALMLLCSAIVSFVVSIMVLFPNIFGLTFEFRFEKLAESIIQLIAVSILYKVTKDE